MNAPRQPTRRRLDHLRAPIDDVGIGGRQDGLTIDGINTNEDAESTLDVPQCPVSDRGRRTIDSVVGRDRTRRRPPDHQ